MFSSQARGGGGREVCIYNKTKVLGEAARPELLLLQLLLLGHSWFLKCPKDFQSVLGLDSGLGGERRVGLTPSERGQ